uniref:CYCLIN domain-containing protein n=1 Tax=Steinernema glaseri TaxID=37863 RepID=A0A1I7YZA3_9BILA
MQPRIAEERNDVCSPPSTSFEGNITMNFGDLPSLDSESTASRASRKRRISTSADARDPKAMKLGEDTDGHVSPPDYTLHADEDMSNHSNGSSDYENENRDPNEERNGDVAPDMCPAFAQFRSDLLQRAARNRPVPPQLNASDLGEEEEVWSIMCRKDELYTRPSRYYFHRHPAITEDMRYLLLDWVMEVCEQEQLHRETFYLVVEYVDRFLSVMQNVPIGHLQRAGATAIYIATKIEEIYPPNLKKVASYTADACTVPQLREYEAIMVQKLEWSLAPITSIHWLAIYFQLLGTRTSIAENGDSPPKKKKAPLTPPTARVPLAPGRLLVRDWTPHKLVLYT